MSKTVLITGGTGFLGRHLARRLRQRFDVVIGARNNEQNRQASAFAGCPARPLDVTRMDSLRDVFNEVRPDIVIHAAATKYVDLSEREPLECVDVNVVGSQNVARVAIDCGAEAVLGISTDKAAPPYSNIYGLSKALMERLFCLLDGRTDTRFACVRFGNIAWSTGSVFPLWKEMQQRGEVIRSTGPHMRRYFFSIDEACDLVETALANFGHLAGKVLACDMKAAQISDILEVWVRERGGRWEQAPARPGDSVDQMLIGEAEVPHASRLQLGGRDYYVIDFRQSAGEGGLSGPLSSATAERLSEDEIRALLREPDM